MKGFFGEFKKFISRGNVMDMAVGVIIGGAFTAIVTSLVNDVLMPVLSLITGGMDFSSMCLVLGRGETPATLNYGNFIAAVINFLLVAFAVFCMVKALNAAKDKVVKKHPRHRPPRNALTVCLRLISKRPDARTVHRSCHSFRTNTGTGGSFGLL